MSGGENNILNNFEIWNIAIHHFGIFIKFSYFRGLGITQWFTVLLSHFFNFEMFYFRINKLFLISNEFLQIWNFILIFNSLYS